MICIYSIISKLFVTELYYLLMYVFSISSQTHNNNNQTTIPHTHIFQIYIELTKTMNKKKHWHVMINLNVLQYLWKNIIFILDIF